MPAEFIGTVAEWQVTHQNREMAFLKISVGVHIRSRTEVIAGVLARAGSTLDICTNQEK